MYQYRSIVLTVGHGELQTETEAEGLESPAAGPARRNEAEVADWRQQWLVAFEAEIRYVDEKTSAFVEMRHMCGLCS